MFDLSLTQQVYPQTLANQNWLQSTKTLAAIVSNAFALEQTGSLEDAIKAHNVAKDMLDQISKIKNVPKFNRKMYERQATVHQERIKYLEGRSKSVIIDPLFIIPTRASLQTFQTASLGSYASHGPLSSTLSSSTPAETTYTLTKSSELVDLGVRSYWFLLKDATETHTLYALQGIIDIDKPLIETLLRRPDEFFPLGGHLHIALQLQADKNFKLRMLTRGQDPKEGVWEVPTKEAGKKEWSPRRFSFGGRYFVWKNQEGKDSGALSKKWAFETLYETATADDGSAIVGGKLFWGRTEGGGFGKTKWSLYAKAGLGLELREHAIASQLTRLMRWSYPPAKDVAGVEKGIVAVGALGTVLGVAEMFS